MWEKKRVIEGGEINRQADSCKRENKTKKRRINGTQLESLQYMKEMNEPGEHNLTL